MVIMTVTILTGLQWRAAPWVPLASCHKGQDTKLIGEDSSAIGPSPPFKWGILAPQLLRVNYQQLTGTSFPGLPRPVLCYPRHNLD